jgi:serine/threonine kinase 3
MTHRQVPVDTDLQDIIKEISIMQQCDSPYVVKYYGSYFKNTDLWIVMEYCGAGSVSDIMRLRKKTMTQEEIATVLCDTLKGLEYLHRRKKIHRDVKAGNILLNNEGHAKLADFGVAGQLTDTMAKRNTVIGTPFWMAPEVIQEIGYDCVADIWSLGITALEMAEGKPPYGDIHPMRAIFMIPTKPPPTFRDATKWSAQFAEFVTRCLVKAPEKRATASELLACEFISTAGSSQGLLEMLGEAAELREKVRTHCILITRLISHQLMAGYSSLMVHHFSLISQHTYYLSLMPHPS